MTVRNDIRKSASALALVNAVLPSKLMTKRWGLLFAGYFKICS